MPNRDRIQTDGYNTTPDEAVELCIHHLRLAAMFFEGTPDDKGLQLYGELQRQVPVKDSIMVLAATNFITDLTKSYQELKDDAGLPPEDKDSLN
jgi:hypothetical protein